MKKLKDGIRGETVEKKSRFLAFIERVDTPEEADELRKKIKKDHPNATHHCYAYIIGKQRENMRSNDDGEPSNSAGAPILDVLQRNDLTDVLAVVVRYYGGIKLGVGGLVRAYGGAVSKALKDATFVETKPVSLYNIVFPYEKQKQVEHYIKANTLSHEASYGEAITMKVSVFADDTIRFLTDVTNATSGDIQITPLGLDEVDAPLEEEV